MRALLILGSCLCLASAAVAAEPDANSYCINRKGEFYPYKDGENCKSGYQLGAGNCRLPNGSVTAAIKADCARQAGTLQLPAPPILTGAESAKPADPKPEPLTPPKEN